MGMEKSVKLIENFVSWQGEGPDSGRAMIILRFKTCNLKCPWCDTSVKMRISAEAPHLLSDIQTQINESKAGLLITGGEPTVERHFNETVTLLNDLDYPVANVESNGYDLFKLIKEVPPSKPVKYIYSPKIFKDSDIETALGMVDLLSSFPQAYIKIVYERTPAMLSFLEQLSKKHEDLKWQHRIWLMPEGTTRSDLIRNAEGVFDACEKYKFNFSSRSHIIFGFV
jgi:organic radical activating enzyme